MDKIYFDVKHSEIPVFKNQRKYFNSEPALPATGLVADISTNDYNFIILSLRFYQKNPRWLEQRWWDITQILSSSAQQKVVVLAVADGEDDDVDSTSMDTLSAYSVRQRFRVMLITSQQMLAHVLMSFADRTSTVQGLKAANDKNKSHYDRCIDFLTHCSRPSLSTSNAIAILEKLNTMSDLFSLKKEDLLSIPGMGEKRASGLYDFIQQDQSTI